MQKKSVYAIAFVLSAGAGVAFGTSPYAAEAAHGALTSLSGWKGCNPADKTAPRCAVKDPRDAQSGMATGAKSADKSTDSTATIKPVTQEHAINTKGTGSAGRAAAPGATANGSTKPANGTKVRTKSNQANE
jgi:hypothetical protein